MTSMSRSLGPMKMLIAECETGPQHSTGRTKTGLTVSATDAEQGAHQAGGSEQGRHPADVLTTSCAFRELSCWLSTGAMPSWMKGHKIRNPDAEVMPALSCLSESIRLGW